MCDACMFDPRTPQTPAASLDLDAHKGKEMIWYISQHGLVCLVGDVAQAVERLAGNRKVASLIPGPS